MPSWPSSQAVSRDPCSSGRVSSAMTWARAPRSRSARITPSAVPQPRQARAPVLQCVCTFSGPAPHSSMRNAAPRSLRRLLTSIAVSRTARAAASTASAPSGMHGRDREHLAAQVDRGRAGVGDPLDLGVQPGGVPSLALGLPDRERHAERAGHPEQRRAPHDEPDDRVDELVHGGDAEDGEPVRKGRLVNSDDVAVLPADNVIEHVVAHVDDATPGGSMMLLPDARAGDRDHLPGTVPAPVSWSARRAT